MKLNTWGWGGETITSRKAPRYPLRVHLFWFSRARNKAGCRRLSLQILWVQQIKPQQTTITIIKMEKAGILSFVLVTISLVIIR